MTLETLKSETLKLLQEYMDNMPDMTDDEDIINNMIPAINKILFELARVKKIDTYVKREVSEGEEIDLKTLPNFYQLKLIKFKPKIATYDEHYYEKVGSYINFNQEGSVTVYYYKYPTMITEDTEDEFELELDQDALNIAPTGIAGTILMTDISNQYGSVFLNEYEKMLQRLDSRNSDTMITIEGGM